MIVTKETAMLFFNNYYHQFHYLATEFNLILDKPEKGLQLNREWPVIYILMVIHPACCFSNTIFIDSWAEGCSHLASLNILTGLIIGIQVPGNRERIHRKILHARLPPQFIKVIQPYIGNKTSIRFYSLSFGGSLQLQQPCLHNTVYTV